MNADSKVMVLKCGARKLTEFQADRIYVIHAGVRISIMTHATDRIEIGFEPLDGSQHVAILPRSFSQIILQTSKQLAIEDARKASRE